MTTKVQTAQPQSVVNDYSAIFRGNSSFISDDISDIFLRLNDIL